MFAAKIAKRRGNILAPMASRVDGSKVPFFQPPEPITACANSPATCKRHPTTTEELDGTRGVGGWARAKHLSSGFDAVSTNRSSSPLGVPVIKDITNGMTGQLILKVTPVPNARAYEVRYALAVPGQPQGPWQNGGLFTNSRSMPINGLTPGQTTSSRSAPSAAAPDTAIGVCRSGI